VNFTEITKEDPESLHTKFLALNMHFNHLSVDVLGSRSLPYGDLKFGYSFKMYYYFIPRCTLIAQMAGPMLLHVMLALFKLLVFC